MNDVWLLNPNFTVFHGWLPYIVSIFVPLNSNFTNMVLVKFTGDVDIYINPSQIVAVVELVDKREIHLCSGTKFYVSDSLEYILSSISQE